MKKIILHLCADLGSDSYPYQVDDNYKVIRVGEQIGVENYEPPENIHGIIANPPCTEFSTARADGKARNPDQGMFLVEHCLRIIEQCKPEWWIIENPARGVLKNYLGDPVYKYEPWWYGSPWTKQTALWGKFNIPTRQYHKWEEVQQNDKLYIRPNRPKPSLAFLHKSAVYNIPEFAPFIDHVYCDADFRSLCSQGFAKAFKEVNP
jgi:site-specific DNA-cytosine methylase